MYKKIYILLIIYYWALHVFVDLSQKESLLSWIGLAQNVPVIFFGLISFAFFFKKKQKKSELILLSFVGLAIFFSILNGDFKGTIYILVFSSIIYIVFHKKIHPPLRLINMLFWGTVVISIVTYHLGVNEFGYIPGHFASESIKEWWRINLFPYSSPPYSAAFSLMVLTYNYLFVKKDLYMKVTAITALYFIIFSGSRTAIIILFSFILLEFLIRKSQTFWVKALPALVLAGTAFLTVMPSYLYQFDTGSIVNSALYRSSEKPSFEEIEANTRVLLWVNLFTVYENSPITGVGNFNLYNYVPNAPSFSENKWLSLLARFGVSAFILFVYFYRKYLFGLKRRAKSEMWVSLMIIIYCMYYGSFMEVYNFIFFLMLGMYNISNHKLVK